LKRVLIVGCGFAGSVLGRELAERGYQVDIIDRRNHIGGNAYDSMDHNGIRVHRYGPHLFHTNNKKVVDWVRQFGDFVPYEHKVQALLPDGRRVPLPINRHTINAVFNVSLTDATDVHAFLASVVQPIESPANAGEYLRANIGEVLTDLFFRPYTRKMWGLELEEMDARVVKRIPLRFDDEDRYFPDDTFQLMPRDGYTRVFEAMLDHDNITVSLDTAFDPSMLKGVTHCFNSMPIDEFYAFRFGPLPYRSIRFHTETVPADHRQSDAPTLNFTDHGPFTRVTDWSKLPCHVHTPGPWKTITREEPCDDTDNHHERYYPVRTSDGRHQRTYALYKDLADQDDRMTFIGRCGTYQYLDMHQVINQSVQEAARWAAAAGGCPANARVAPSGY
jgi:UDP-galactopyranose mutase